MASNALLAEIKFYANKNGLDPDNYTNRKILLREREVLNSGMTSAEFARLILDEVSGSNHRQGYSKCPGCGQNTLIHEDGCMHCRSCGWSACG